MLNKNCLIDSERNALNGAEVLSLEQEYKKISPPLTDQQWLEIFPEARSYLKQRTSGLKKEIKADEEQIVNSLAAIYEKKGLDEFTLWFKEEIIKTFSGEDFDKKNKELIRLKVVLSENKNAEKYATLQAIKKAKDYPFELLLKPDREIKQGRYLSLCPFHKEKNPSFSVKNNFGHCFGCGWSGDTIKFLMETQIKTFLEAIKFLQ